MNIRLNLDNVGEIKNSINKNYDEALAIMDYLRQDKEDYTGWVNWPMNIPAELIDKMTSIAADIQTKFDTMVVAGIGGSYLGTAAVIDATGGNRKGYPEIVYAGNNMSGATLAGIVDIVREKNACLCVVSKSGGTMETRIAFSVIKEELRKKYGNDISDRIIAITDPVKGILREEVNAEGYRSFEIPGNIGGRYSAFTAGIMFPLAVAGVDIKAFVEGAKDIAADKEFWKSEGVKYALTRFALNNAGKDVEVFEYYNPSFRLIGEWCKQLFGESEGKEGKGIFPASLTLSTDLHSMGQYLQDGKHLLFETILNVENWDRDVVIPASAGDAMAGRSLNEINHLAMEGVIAAHRQADVPIIRIDIKDNKEYSIGQLLYFLMMTAGVTGKLMKIDPFTQDGVEQYKAEIRRLLGK